MLKLRQNVPKMQKTEANLERDANVEAERTKYADNGKKDKRCRKMT
jgi:hypothetical protein